MLVKNVIKSSNVKVYGDMSSRLLYEGSSEKIPKSIIEAYVIDFNIKPNYLTLWVDK